MAYAEASLKHLLGLQETNFDIIRFEITDSKIVYHIEHDSKNPVYICPHCEKKHTAMHGSKWIKLYDYPLGPRQVVWLIKRVKVLCCRMSPVVESLPFRSEGHRLTRRFEAYIENLLCTKMMTVADVARLFNLDYSVIYKIDHRVLLRLWQTMEIPDPINIAVDEKSFKKGRQYVTIVTDIDKGKVVWVSPGNSKESLDLFFKILGPERCAKIRAVAKDMHNPYIQSCKEYVPQAMEVADPFHVVQRLNQALDEGRREVSYGSAFVTRRKQLIPGLQWLLRHKNENLRARQRQSIEELAKVNEPLYHAYLLKESFYEIFTYRPSEIEDAKQFLREWVDDAYKIKLEALHAFADYVRTHQERILNSLKTKLSSAIAEGINNKISVIKRMAYGYRNIQYFMLKILQRCGVLGKAW